MTLTNRDRFNLRTAMAQQYRQPNEIRQVATVAGINLINVVLTGNAGDDWETLIDRADKAQKLEKLIQNEVEKNVDNGNFRAWLTEVQRGIPDRLDRLARAIRDGECILFLGAGTLLGNVPDPADPDGNRFVQMTFGQAFAQSLATLMDDSNIYYDRQKSARANLAYITQRYSELSQNIPGMQGKLAQAFYQTFHTDRGLYEKLAELPFRTVINTNPDTELVKIMNEQRPDSAVLRYYNMTNSEATAEPPAPLLPGQTLVYNLLGTFDDRLSMILTESQLLDFTNRILNRNPALDPAITDEFAVAETAPKTYLFVGFDFDQWYVKIVFQGVLKLVKQKDRSYSIFPRGLDYSQFNRDFFEEEFKCYFIDYNLTHFVDELVTTYHNLPPNDNG